ncbi:uncharacterized protein LOC103524210 [Diaphorina citri]|uniref:Uncharacterized protein LOC103524210 n=1 Tax=Diaphorina citri TaxID=121845 RepID=A0A3Q0JL55_DIACI|nr:uncharacterized protein LOC103524210 [Diaphorina citri]
MVVKMSTTLDSQEDTTPPPIVPAATSFVVSFDPPQPPANCRPNKFVKRHMRNLSLPVANVYCTENNNKINKYNESNGITKPPENHSEGYFSSDPEDDTQHVELIKPSTGMTSLETTPRGSRTSLCSLGTNSSSSNVKLKPTKIEGVDSMVITAIASMSCKLKANSSHFLRKLRVLYSEENVKHGLLSNEIEKLDLADSLNNSPVKSPSRQLTATLCNLKKIESALRVMDEAIFDCEEFE